MWYMNLDNNNNPNGWSNVPSTGYIAVSQEIRYIHEGYAVYIWNGITLVAPAVIVPEPQQPYVPQSISMRQTRLYLYDLDAGATLSAVEAYVLTMPPKAQIEWNTSAEVWRTSPMVEQMRLMFGWTTKQMDQMFIDGNTL